VRFFIDGRIPKYFMTKIMGTHESPILSQITEVKSEFSEDVTSEILNFFIEEDNKLTRGLPRWILVEAIAEAFEISQDLMIFKQFYRTSSENPVWDK